MSKKSSKGQKKPAAAKTKPVEELADDQLEHVTGGASNYFLQLEGIKGEAQKKGTQGSTPTETVSFNFTKPAVT
jgi:hypothetical protein